MHENIGYVLRSRSSPKIIQNDHTRVL